MTCTICGKETDWDSSYGRTSFLVCSVCHKKITDIIAEERNHRYDSETIATLLICEIGWARDKRGDEINED